MLVTERILNGVAVLDVVGTLTGSEQGRVKKSVTNLVIRGDKRIVLNLRGLTFIDSVGLGELVSCYTRATRADATIALANVDPRVHYLLEVTKVLILFDTFDSEAAAAAGFARRAA